MRKAPIKNKERICLIGFMGSGKSTCGKALAQALDYTYIDTDQIIEAQEGMKIAELFAQKGEAYFRAQETKCIKELASKSNIVVATGGGLPITEGNMTFIKAHFFSVYLKASYTLIADRVSLNQDRPLVNNASRRSLLISIADRYSVRKPIYEQADYQLNSKLAVSTLVAKLSTMLSAI